MYIYVLRNKICFCKGFPWKFSPRALPVFDDTNPNPGFHAGYATAALFERGPCTPGKSLQSLNFQKITPSTMCAHGRSNRIFDLPRRRRRCLDRHFQWVRKYETSSFVYDRLDRRPVRNLISVIASQCCFNAPSAQKKWSDGTSRTALATANFRPDVCDDDALLFRLSPCVCTYATSMRLLNAFKWIHGNTFPNSHQMHAITHANVHPSVHLNPGNDPLNVCMKYMCNAAP